MAPSAADAFCVCDEPHVLLHIVTERAPCNEARCIFHQSRGRDFSGIGTAACFDLAFITSDLFGSKLILKIEALSAPAGIVPCHELLALTPSPPL